MWIKSTLWRADEIYLQLLKPFFKAGSEIIYYLFPFLAFFYPTPPKSTNDLLALVRSRLFVFSNLRTKFVTEKGLTGFGGIIVIQARNVAFTHAFGKKYALTLYFGGAVKRWLFPKRSILFLCLVGNQWNKYSAAMGGPAKAGHHLPLTRPTLTFSLNESQWVRILPEFWSSQRAEDPLLGLRVLQSEP